MGRLNSISKPDFVLILGRVRGVVRHTWHIWRTAVNRCSGPAAEAGLVLGSSRLPLRLRGSGRPLDHGSCIATDITGKLLATGDEAVRLEGRAPADVKVSRPIRRGRIDDIRGGRRLLEDVLRASGHGVVRGPSLVVAVSSDMTPIERRTVTEVALSAGARRVYLVDQSLLAALGAGLPIFEPEGRLVADLGAGKVEISLLSTGEPVQVRSLADAGDRMDRDIQHYLRTEHHLLVGRHTAEHLKKTLGAARPRPEPRQLTVAGRDLMSGLPGRRIVNSREIEQVLVPLLEEIADEIRCVIKEAPAQLASDVVARGLLLAGGGARLWGLAEFLTEEIGLEVHLPDEPERLIARGLQRLLREPALRKRLLSQPRSRPALSRKRTTPAARAAAVVMLALTLWGCSASVHQPAALVGMANSINAVLTPIWRLTSSGRPATAAAASAVELDRRISVLQAENAHLRRLAHGPDRAAPWTRGSIRTARVIARSPRSWSSSVVIDAGKQDGVEPGSVVVSLQGLVGRVSRVAPTSAQVALSGAVGAITGGRVARAETAGVLFGRGPRGYRMRYLNPDSAVKVGQEVFTSGLDGHYPQGILVGRIARLMRPNGELYLSADVRPSVDLDRLDEVTVLGRHSR